MTQKRCVAEKLKNEISGKPQPQWIERRRNAIMNRQEQIEAAVVLFSAILCLTGSSWKAILVGIFVLVSCVRGFGRRWLLLGSFAIAIVAIAVVVGAPSPDQWAQLWQDARRAFSVWLPGY